MAQYQDDEDETTPQDDATAVESADQQAGAAVPPTPALAVPSVADYIKQKYGIGSTADTYNKLASDSAAATQTARANAKDYKNNLGMVQGLAQMFHGRGKGDDEYYAGLGASADRQADQVQQAGDAKLKGLVTEHTLGTEDTNQGYKDAAEKEKTEQRNPDSDSSKALRGFIKAAAPNMQLPPDFDKASYAQLEKVYPTLISTYESGQARIESQKARGQLAADAAADRRQRQDVLDADKKDKAARTELIGAQTRLNSETKDYSKAAAAADDLDAKIDEAKTNPTVNAMLPVAIARAAVGTGRINQVEIQKAGGSQAILDRAQQIAQNLTEGTLTPENAAWMKKMASLAKQGAQRGIQDAEERHAGQYVQAHPDKPFESAYSDLTGGKTYARQVTKTDPDGTVHTATVGSLKELKEAQAEGFK